MDEKDFLLLTDLARTRNLTKSAQRLYTTQSALTKRVQKLEEELGSQLFFRTAKGLLLTPLLEELLPHLQAVTDSLDRIRNLCASQGEQIAGTLTLGVSSNYARYRLPDVLEKYRSRYPRVDIHFNAHRSPSLYRALQEGELSMAVIRGEYPWEGEDIVLSEEPLCLVVGAQMAGTPLDRLTYIAREADVGYISDLSRWRKENGLHPSRSDLVISDVPTVLTLVERGIGWSVLPRICLDNFHGEIRPLFFQSGKPFTRRTHVLYRTGYDQLPQVRAFLEIAREQEEQGKKP